MARRAYDPDNPEAYEAQRNMLDLYGNYVQGPRTDRSPAYDLGLWGSAGVPMFEQLSGDEGGVNFTENTPLTFNKNGQEMFRIGQRGTQIPDVWKGTEYEKQIQFDPQYGYYMPKDSFFAAQKLFPKDMGWLGPLGMMGAMFALPMLTQMGVIGAGAAGSAGAEAGASAGGGSALAGGEGGSLLGGGVDFSSSYLPTLTSGGGTAATAAGPLSSLGDMASVLGSGGSLTTGGLGAGLEASLGLPAGGLTAALQGTGVTIPGPLGNLTLDSAGNAVNTGVNLGNSAQTLAGAGSDGGGGGGGGSTTNTPASALSKFLKDNLGMDVNPGTLGLLGSLLGTGLGVYGANQQADQTKDLYDRFFGLGQPYRDSLSQLNSNPESFYSSPMFQGALQQGSDALARSLSAKVGNPILNPTALQEMQNYTTRGSLDAYNNRWNQLASAGQLGVSQSAPLGLQNVQAQGGVPNALGAGLASVFGNQRDYTGEFLDLMRKGLS